VIGQMGPDTRALPSVLILWLGLVGVFFGDPTEDCGDNCGRFALPRYSSAIFGSGVSRTALATARVNWRPDRMGVVVGELGLFDQFLLDFLGIAQVAVSRGSSPAGLVRHEMCC